MDRLTKMAGDLGRLGFLTDVGEGEVLVGRIAGGSRASLHVCGGWLQVAACIAREQQLEESLHAEALTRWLFDLQDRYLGCRFALDPSGALGVVADVYPAQQTTEAISEVVDQVVYVAEALQPLVATVLLTGRAPDSATVDAAFAAADVH